MRAFFLIGLEETIEEIELTKQLIRDIAPNFLGVSILSPYPGTKYYRDKFKNEDWETIDMHNSFWSTKYFSNKDLYKIQKEIYVEFKDNVIYHQRYKI